MEKKITIDCNTFHFFVKNDKVICNQDTDFTGTELEEDFPDGHRLTFSVPYYDGISEKANINRFICRILKDGEKYTI